MFKQTIYFCSFSISSMFENSFINTTRSFTHIFLFQSRSRISKTSALPSMWVLVFLLLIKLLIVFEELVTVLIARLSRFFANVCG